MNKKVKYIEDSLSKYPSYNIPKNVNNYGTLMPQTTTPNSLKNNKLNKVKSNSFRDPYKN